MTERVVLAAYTDAWRSEFARFKAFLTPRLAGVITEIHHVGSTSVAGLDAKPILDVDIEIADMRVFPVLSARLAALGYRREGDLGISGREAFAQTRSDGFTERHLYVCPFDSPELRRHLTFRNDLRANPAAARAFGDLKRALARKFGNDREAYTNGKTNSIEACLRKAEVKKNGRTDCPAEYRPKIGRTACGGRRNDG